LKGHFLLWGGKNTFGIVIHQKALLLLFWMGFGRPLISTQSAPKKDLKKFLALDEIKD